jgi:hypothetical protein
MQTLTDNQLHELARKRVEFKRHLLSYFVPKMKNFTD